MQAQRVQWSGLDCVVVEPAEKVRGMVVLCHGFGASGTDLIDLAPALVECEAELSSLGFVFPAAPRDLAEEGMPGGRAWWPIDMLELTLAVQRGTVRDLRKQVPPELAAVRLQLKQVIEQACNHWQLTSQKAFLGGFSQGAMITSAVALQEELPVAGLCVLSGTLLCEADWTAAIAKQKESGSPAFPVFQSHGTSDPILPFDNAEALRDLLKSGGHAVDFVPFAGQHQIPQQVLQRMAKWLVERLPT